MADVVLSMGRKERRQHGEEYIRGLLMEGERKSIEPMASRLPDGDAQALQQFVNQSPWSSGEVRASLARKVEQEFVPEAYWLIDEVSFPKQGQHSVGVARQYCGALGKNGQLSGGGDVGSGYRGIEYAVGLGFVFPREMGPGSGSQEGGWGPRGDYLQDETRVGFGADR
ncbi:MAG: transposase [Proteobacteria bacterium]|nr:transposase [Pseudomonadota bacterium]